MKRRAVFSLLFVLLCFPHWSAAQDDGQWTCDDGPNDVLNAAQAAYEAGELDRAYELEQIAEAVCGSGITVNMLRYQQALMLRMQLEREMQPTATPGMSQQELRQRSIALNDQGLALNEQGRYAEALVMYEEALVIVRQLGERWGEGVILQNIGDVYYNQGQYTAALERYFEALAIRREVGDRLGEGTTLNNIGAVYEALGQYPSALDYYTLALTIWREADDRAGEGMTLNNIGLVHYDQGRYTAALDEFFQALALWREVGNRAGEGTTLNNIGLVYETQGQYTAALEYLFDALAIHREVGNRRMEGTTLNNIGLVYEAQGQYAEALYNLQQALAIAREMGNRAGEGTTLNNIGEVYRDQGQYTLALRHYTQALAIAREVGNRAGEGTTFHNIGLVYDSQRAYEAALRYYTQALALRREVGDRAGEAVTLNNMGMIYKAQGQYEEAQDYLTQALAIAREVGNREGEGTLLGNIGLVYKAQGQYTLALEHYTQALAISREVGDRVGEVVTLGNRAITYESLERYDEAIADYEAATTLIETVLSDAALDSAITSLAAQTRNQYPYQRLAILVAREQNDPLRAINYVERGRALLVRTELTLVPIDFRTTADTALITQERTLRTSVDDAQRFLDSLRRDTGASNDVIQDAQQALDTARSSYESHLQTMQLQGGFLARQIAHEPATFGQITAALPDDTTLVVYTLGTKESAAYLLTPGGIHLTTWTTGQQEIEEAVATFVSDRRAAGAALRDLYDLVFGPIADNITTSRLIIVPDGPLNYVPFAALQAPDDSYLIDHYSISVVSSGTTLVLLSDRAQQTQAESTSPALVLAQPSAPGFPTLRNAPLEALEVADLLGVDPNPNATEADLRANATGSEVLYITAHAELDRFAPLFSVIHLGAGSNYDGRLEVREIYELDLSQGTELVVLSGCETASGGDGEDFGLLTRAFFAAGTPRVVASLWRVDDAATADLMTAFMTERANHDNDADALRAAMLATREQYPEPYYWASFELSGLP